MTREEEIAQTRMRAREMRDLSDAERSRRIAEAGSVVVDMRAEFAELQRQTTELRARRRFNPGGDAA